MWKLEDNIFYYFCVFFDNIVVILVVVNLIVVNLVNLDKVVFYFVIDEVNYVFMKVWFFMNDFRGVIVDV